MARQSYTVIFEHGDRPNQWLASVKEVEGCHTFGRGLKQTRERIREALMLWVGKLPKDVEINEVFPLPKVARERLETLLEVRSELRGLRLKQEKRLFGVVRTLTERGWSARDVGSLIGVSYQRISQVSRSAEQPPSKKSRKKLSRR